MADCSQGSTARRGRTVGPVPGTAGWLAGTLDDPRLQPLLPKVEPFVRIAGQVGCTPSQLAIAYCLRNPLVASVLFGSRSVAQVRENVGALAVAARLTDDVLSALAAL